MRGREVGRRVAGVGGLRILARSRSCDATFREVDVIVKEVGRLSVPGPSSLRVELVLSVLILLEKAGVMVMLEFRLGLWPNGDGRKVAVSFPSCVAAPSRSS